MKIGNKQICSENITSGEKMASGETDLFIHFPFLGVYKMLRILLTLMRYDFTICKGEHRHERRTKKKNQP